MSGGLDGKIALVTGSTRGIGLATAEALGKAGAQLVITSRNADACQIVADRFVAQGIAAIARPGHVGQSADRRRLVEATLEAYGRIDIFVANAAVNPVFASVGDFPRDAWDKVIETNLTSVLDFAQLILPLCAAQRGGAMVAVSSIASRKVRLTSPAYAVSKAALEHLVRHLAAEWGPCGVRVNSVVPGPILTDMIRSTLGTDEALAGRLAGIPLRRLGTPEDVASVIAFLCSDPSRHITGQSIVVDGGETIL